jgi:NAD(P)-dependent dehydrogenase (short-subunit alcohol dehydrogenase family)
VSLAFLNEGAELIVTYRRDHEFVELKSKAGTSASRLSGRHVDVTDEAAVQQLIDGVLVEHGRLDVLVNTIGGFIGGEPLWELDTGSLDQMLALNLRSSFLLSRAAVKAMLGKGTGAIINVASRAAFDHAAGFAAYAASKAAAVALMDCLAADLKGSGVRVNSVLPSMIDTELNRKLIPGADVAKWTKAEDIARVILFLGSEEAKVIHGAALPVYGNS